MLLGLLTAAASSSPSMYHQDKQQRQNYAASPSSSSPSSSSPSSPTYSPASSPSASNSSLSSTSTSPSSSSSHKLSAKAAAAGMYDFLSMKCQNRECSNVRGYPDKPNSIYCSSRCQSREQNLRQGRVKNVHKLPAALGVAKNQLKSPHASSAPSVILPHNPSSATPTNQFHNPHALSFSSPPSSAPAFQPPHPHSHSRSHHDLPHAHGLPRSHYPHEEPRHASPPFAMAPPPSLSSSSSSSSFPMNYHQHQQHHQSHGNHVSAHVIKSEPYPLNPGLYSHHLPLHAQQQQQQHVHGSSVYQHQEHQYFHHQQQNMGPHSVVDNPRGPHHLLPPPPSPSSHSHPFHALPPPLPLPQQYGRFPAPKFAEPQSPPSVVSKESQSGSRLGLLSLCIAADVEPSVSSSPDDNDKEEKHSLSFILS